jgi:magnesium transporter
MAQRTGPLTEQQLRTDLRRSNLADQAVLVEEASVDDAVKAVGELAPDHQRSLLRRLDPDRRAAIFSSLAPDERARLLADVEEPDAWLAELGPTERELTARLLRHPPESVGRMMTPRYLEVSRDETREDVLDRVRHCASEVETIYTLPVTDEGRLVGVVDLRRLMSAPDGTSVGEVLGELEEWLTPDQDQEVAARMVLATEALAIPVTEGDSELVGLVTIDDAMEVLQQEESEDISMASGSEPLGQPYLAASLLRLARSRATWLVVAAAAAALTVRVLEFFEAELEQVVALALFIPLLLGTGGNSGAQATTTVVRAMALGEVRLRDLPRVVGRELQVGVMLGVLLATLAAPLVAWIYDARLALVVSLTLVSICAIATAIGAVLPLVVAKFGHDPAVVSAPGIHTLVDAVGLLVYFLFARMVFGL